MFQKLRDLVFGFGEFEKTKLEVRFDIIFSLLPELKIQNIENFEILEETLYKLREQLRVKSSNLNRVVKDQSKKLTRKDVNYLIDKLNELKYNFLKRAFNLMEKSPDIPEITPETNKTYNDDVKHRNYIENNNKNINQKIKEIEELEEQNEIEEPQQYRENEEINKQNEEEQTQIKEQEDDNSLESLLEPTNPSKNKEELNKIENEIKKEIEKNNEEKHKNTPNNNETSNNIKEQEEEITLIEDNNFKAWISSGKIPSITIKFNNEIEMGLVKTLASSLFETYNAHGTNIIIEKNKVLIIPRFMQDNFFEMPRISTDIENIYNKLIENKKNINEPKNKEKNKNKKTVDKEIDEIVKSKTKKKTNAIKEYYEDKEEEQPNNEKEHPHNYPELESKKELENIKKYNDNSKEDNESEDEKTEFEEYIDDEQKEEKKLSKTEEEFKKDSIDLNYEKALEKPTLKKKEESLDELLSSSEKTHEPKNKIEPKKDKEEPEIIEGEKIEVEKKPINEIKETTAIENDENIKFEKSNEESTPFLIYQDKQIKAYLSKYTKAPGEIIVETADNKKINDISESEISYLTLFSKAFASILFETKNPHGTNIIFDFDDNKLRIIPRFTEDDVGLTWTPKTHSQDFLDQIREKLLSQMQEPKKKSEPTQNIQTNQNQQQAKQTEQAKQIEPTQQNPPAQQNQQIPNSKTKISSNELKEKAEFLLKALKRIP